MKVSSITNDIINELNLLRSDPSNYCVHLQAHADRFVDDYIYVRPNRTKVRTKEGVAEVYNCIQFLQQTSPLPLLNKSVVLDQAAHDHCIDCCTHGLLGHKGSDESITSTRIERYGKWHVLLGENLRYGNDNVRDIVVAWLIDDNRISRSNRNNILNPKFQLAGSALGRHEKYGPCCVLTLAHSVEINPEIILPVSADDTVVTSVEKDIVETTTATTTTAEINPPIDTTTTSTTTTPLSSSNENNSNDDSDDGTNRNTTTDDSTLKYLSASTSALSTTIQPLSNDKNAKRESNPMLKKKNSKDQSQTIVDIDSCIGTNIPRSRGYFLGNWMATTAQRNENDNINDDNSYSSTSSNTYSRNTTVNRKSPGPLDLSQYFLSGIGIQQWKNPRKKRQISSTSTTLSPFSTNNTSNISSTSSSSSSSSVTTTASNSSTMIFSHDINKKDTNLKAPIMTTVNENEAYGNTDNTTVDYINNQESTTHLPHTIITSSHNTQGSSDKSSSSSNDDTSSIFSSLTTTTTATTTTAATTTAQQTNNNIVNNNNTNSTQEDEGSPPEVLFREPPLASFYHTPQSRPPSDQVPVPLTVCCGETTCTDSCGYYRCTPNLGTLLYHHTNNNNHNNNNQDDESLSSNNSTSKVSPVVFPNMYGKWKGYWQQQWVKYELSNKSTVNTARSDDIPAHNHNPEYTTLH